MNAGSGSVLGALRHRDFRLYCAGQIVSLLGTWMQSVAQAWLVYRLTGSGAALGVVGAAGLLPVLAFGLAGGMLADRLPRRALFAGTQLLAAALAATLAALTLTGAVRAWHVAAVAAALGLVHAVEIPTRHALVGNLVPREALPNAVGLNSALFNLARFAGPALAGLLVRHWGEGPVFALNAASYLAVVAAVAAMSPAADGGARAGRREAPGALAYAAGDREVLCALAVLAAGSLGGGAYTVVLPLITDRVLGAGPGTLGALMAAAGGGALVGALALAARGRPGGLARLARLAAGGVALGLALLALATHPLAAGAATAFLGFCTTSLVASTNAYLQVRVPDRVRGRLMALAATTFMGALAVGQLAGGGLADLAGPRAAVALAALPVLAGLAAVLSRRPRRRAPPP